MSKKIVTGQDLNRWRYDHGFVAGTAAECFGIQKAKWEALVRSDEIITDVRIINIYNMYTLYPETIPVPPSFDYIGLFNELGFSNDMKGKTEFARLLDYPLLVHTGLWIKTLLAATLKYMLRP